jgi:phospholipid/cholesterol/gamma-HCH transport system permease protein
VFTNSFTDSPMARSEPSSPSLLRAVGGTVVDAAATIGEMLALLGKILARSTPSRFDRKELLRHLEFMAVESLPIVVATALFTGAIVVIQAAPVVQRFGAEGLLGWGAGFGVLREIGPLLTALMISGRVGANNTADLGTMVVTEQVDGLRALAIDPIEYLVVPRFFGLVSTLTLMTIFSDLLALFGAALASQALIGLSVHGFYNGIAGGLIELKDVAHGIIKSGAFGFIVALSSCHFGLRTSGGAPGVGRSVKSSVVTSAAGIFALDYFLSFVVP